MLNRPDLRDIMPRALDNRFLYFMDAAGGRGKVLLSLRRDGDTGWLGSPLSRPGRLD
jgi:hypothetical protein